MKKELVSIIMLSHNDGKYVAETIRSIQNQTYQDWELIILDDSSKDDTISQMMELRGIDKRIFIFQTVFCKGSGVNRISALENVHGRWISFIDVGDLWEPDKLDRQVCFMKTYDCGFSYTKCGLVNENLIKIGYEITGPQKISYVDMLKCCWPETLTVMYDTEKIGKIQLQTLNENNDYALFLQICEKVDCLLLDDCLASKRDTEKWYYPQNWKGKIFWRYEVYRKVVELNPFKSMYRTIINLIYTVIKKTKYVKKVL